MADQRGQHCPQHSPCGYACACDEDRDRAAGIHRPGSVGNAFGGYDCVCGGAWLTTFNTCTGPPMTVEDTDA